MREQADLAIDLALPVVLITNVLAQHCHVLREWDDTETKTLVFSRPVLYSAIQIIVHYNHEIQNDVGCRKTSTKFLQQELSLVYLVDRETDLVLLYRVVLEQNPAGLHVTCLLCCTDNTVS